MGVDALDVILVPHEDVTTFVLAEEPCAYVVPAEDFTVLVAPGDDHSA